MSQYFSEQIFLISQIIVVLILMGSCGWYVHYFLGLLERKLSVSSVGWERAMLSSARLPVRYLLWIFGVTWSLQIINKGWPIPILDAANPFRKTFVILIVTWFFWIFIRKLKMSSRVSESEIDHGVLNTSLRLSQLALLIVTLLMILQTHGYSISSILAFGGVGGVAIGFAAKDMLANVFGGLMLHFDRPCQIGEMIRFVDGDIEGTVEEIGWRKTIIRTPDRKPVYVPNSLFSNLAVENISRRDSRRIQFKIGLCYEDMNRIESITNKIESFLLSNKGVDKNRILQVTLDAYQDSSVDILIDCFSIDKSLIGWRAVKHDILMETGRIVDELGASFAFPTRTIFNKTLQNNDLD